MGEDLDKLELSQTSGIRLREAREMAGLSRLQAVKMLGYSGAKLSKIENGKHLGQIPLWLLKRSAELYDVSLDYLVGIKDEMGRDDIRRVIMREMAISMRESWERMRDNDVDHHSSMIEQVVMIEDSTALIEREAQKAQEAMARFIKANQRGWPDFRGGVRLESAIEKTAQRAIRCRADIRKFRAENATVGGCAQLSLNIG